MYRVGTVCVARHLQTLTLTLTLTNQVEGERSFLERAIVRALPLSLREGIVLGKAVTT